MKTTIKRKISVVVLVVLCMALGIAAVACNKNNEPPKDPVSPVKVSDGIDFEVAAGKTKNITVADYITENDYPATASSSSAHATAAVSEGLLTVMGVSEGEATVTLTSKDISVTFGVAVFTEYTVTVDGKTTEVRKGGTFTLPAAPAIADPNKEFDCWLVGEEYKAPGDKITVNSNITITSVTKNKTPVIVKQGEAIAATVGTNVEKVVAEYITAYGTEVTAESSDPDKVTVTVADGNITFVPKAEGSATVTVRCGDKEITFEVTVTVAPAKTYTVTVDGENPQTVTAGGTFVLPAAPSVSEPDFEFKGWKVGNEVKQPGEAITVNENMNITRKLERKAAEKVANGITVKLTTAGASATKTLNVADYINTHGNNVSAESKDVAKAIASVDKGVLTITAVAVGDTTVELACGDITVTFAVNVTQQTVEAPTFADGNIAFDYFTASSGSYAFEITPPQGLSFTYSYIASPSDDVSIADNALTYTATGAVSKTITVDVTANEAGGGVAYASFTVTVNVTDTTPTAKQAAVTAENVVDLFGAHTVDLAANMNNAGNVTSYKVNAVAVSGTTYEITGEYNDEPTDLTLDVEAIIEGKASVTYTYTVKVIDSTAYRVKNGSFDNDLTDWTLSNNDLGAVNDAALYWNEKIPFNADGKFFNAYTNVEDRDGDKVAISGNEGAKGTLTSSTFKVNGSGWITYKLGGARSLDAVYASAVRVSDNKEVKLPNFDWCEAELQGCALRAYKVNLIDYCGFEKDDEVFVRFIDNAESNYGLFFVDSVVTYYAQDPGDGYSLITRYKLYNGGFETGDLDGWTLEGDDIGVVTKDSNYWIKNNPVPSYNKDGNCLFSWWTWDGDFENGHEVNRENNTGTLKSSEFVLKAGQTVSFKFGGGNGNNNIYIEFVDAESGNAIAKFYNTNGNDGTLIQYYYTFETETDKNCYIRIVDNASGGPWGCFSADSFITYGDVVKTGFEASNQL